MLTRVRRWGPGLLLISPSLLLLGVFVYGLIGWTIKVSMSDRHTAAESDGFVGLSNYVDLFTNDINGRFLHSLRNLLIFTVVFLLGTMLLGLLWAFLLERGVRAEGLFRTVYLFPMALSFVASGVVWRWLMNSGQGDDAGGLNEIFGQLNLTFLQNPWWTDPEWGMVAMAVPAIWQLSGYVMALFLAGFRGIPAELREAAAVDGASTFQLYRRVLFPQLTPVALSALIIVGHMSMKMFDLIMSVSGAQWLTEVPAVYVWQTLLTSDYAKASAISVILLLLVAMVIVPYLVQTMRTERRS
ncbi:carbohydrate ABC transporter permease [Salinispora tropica]|uniref:Binding-protein-dependent transport systems inner membrane component n=1 Tax=Salinispora tropica (strain ATCC BAA-916 / DSM 44818 / JCM 13857 / NBRC 105044 / CNB-440) TaxID=369723 RepID=A4X9V7_SALTO|nr:sugar ABC transporter permease [Salinispora tropica]ABP55697.1 binding-protein-dependent transport systems inner membrane component [Salinispora tropica CNB-440]